VRLQHLLVSFVTTISDAARSGPKR
jgi:hypothetical protein